MLGVAKFPCCSQKRMALCQNISSIPKMVGHIILYLTISVNININDIRQEILYNYLLSEQTSSPVKGDICFLIIKSALKRTSQKVIETIKSCLF